MKKLNILERICLVTCRVTSEMKPIIPSSPNRWHANIVNANSQDSTYTGFRIFKDYRGIEYQETNEMVSASWKLSDSL